MFWHSFQTDSSNDSEDENTEDMEDRISDEVNVSANVSDEPISNRLSTEESYESPPTPVLVDASSQTQTVLEDILEDYLLR